MKLKFIAIAMIIVFTSCQSHKPQQNYKGRTIASSGLLKTFFAEIAQSSKKYTVRELEEAALAYIKRKEKNAIHGNWSQLGLSADEATQMKSLYDDLPSMPKVREWITENITQIVKVETRLARRAYSLIDGGKFAYKNPYVTNKAIKSRVTSQRDSSLGFKSISDKQSRVLDNVQDLKTPTISRHYRKTLLQLQRRAGKEPAIYANGLEIVEDAAAITRRTGLNAMGEGCPQFYKNLSSDISSSVEAFNNRVKQIIQEESVERAGKEFKHFSEIPKNKRLTKHDLTEARVQSFQDIQGYSETEAREVVKKLSRKPCSVF